VGVAALDLVTGQIMARKSEKKNNSFGFIRVAAMAPPVKVGDIENNTAEIINHAKKASAIGAKVIVSPELGITGYTVADLFQQQLLLK